MQKDIKDQPKFNNNFFNLSLQYKVPKIMFEKAA